MKKKNKNNYIIIGSIIFILLIFIFIVCYTYESNTLKSNLKKDGYDTKNIKDAFYKKIVTNNTLEDYYKDVSNKQQSSYEEYYLSKESYDFIEVKLNYQNNTSKSLNITSNLRTLEISYNYELSYDKSLLIIEGSSTEEYKCNYILKENINDNAAKSYCEEIQDEISIYLQRREEILNNKKVQELLQEPIKEIKEN